MLIGCPVRGSAAYKLSLTKSMLPIALLTSERRPRRLFVSSGLSMAAEIYQGIRHRHISHHGIIKEQVVVIAGKNGRSVGRDR